MYRIYDKITIVIESVFFLCCSKEKVESFLKYLSLSKSKENKLPKTEKERTAQFERQIAEIKKNGVGKKYDAILGVSGGVDSTYLAWLCKENGLRVLLMHCDNGWNSELAVMNIQNLCEKTGFDLHTFVMDWDSFKDLQLAFIKAGVVDIELPYDYALYILMGLIFYITLLYFSYGDNGLIILVIFALFVLLNKNLSYSK